jgi:hypothetical protein
VVACDWTDQISFVEIATGAVEKQTCTVSNQKQTPSLAITPDGSYALVGTYNGIQLINLKSRSLDPNPISMELWTPGQFNWGGAAFPPMAITPDGKTAIAGSQKALVRIDLAQRKVVGTIDGLLPGSIAMTADGATALVIDWSPQYQTPILRVLDVTNFRLDGDPVNFDVSPQRAVPINDAWAVVSLASFDGILTLLDVGQRREAEKLMDLRSPGDMAIGNGSCVLVVDCDAQTVRMI